MYSNQKLIKLVVLQRVCTNYRIPLFRKLTEDPNLDFTLFIGDDLPNSKVKNAPSLDGINIKRFKTRFIHFGHRVFPWHFNLIKELRQIKPEVILCEGESNLMGYLRAIAYKLFFNRKVTLIHWCFIGLPGEKEQIFSMPSLLKRFFRLFFDAFLVYSSYSKDRLIKLGGNPDKIFVATNVGEVQKGLCDSQLINLTKFEVREKLLLPNRFTILYVGTIEENKKPEMLLDIAAMPGFENFNFVLLGNGKMLKAIQERVKNDSLNNVFTPGRVVDDLRYYYKASDFLVIPGRGGIVISESMSHGVPVIVYQADGTEYDLIKNNITGIHLAEGNVEDFANAIRWGNENPDKLNEMSIKCRYSIENEYTTEAMIQNIKKALSYTLKQHNNTL